MSVAKFEVLTGSKSPSEQVDELRAEVLAGEIDAIAIISVRKDGDVRTRRAWCNREPRMELVFGADCLKHRLLDSVLADATIESGGAAA